VLFRAVISSAFALAALPVSNAGAQPRQQGSHLNAHEWVIGPIIGGRSYSPGMPLHPSPGPGRAWHVELPHQPASLHAVTFRQGSLARMSRIVMRYRIEAAPGVRIEPTTAPGGVGLLTLFFQRSGDNWSARGRYEAYRWYATFATKPMTPGEHEIVATLNANWTAVQVSSARNNPAGFSDAVINADHVGFVLGGGEGYGKGVFATGPARLVVTDFRVE
jgi:hypothetical protein